MGDSIGECSGRAGDQLICGKCGHDNDMNRIGFKATCPKCSTYLHSCVHCSLLDRTIMSCRSHTTEEVGDREANNYCEEFLPSQDVKAPSEDDPQKIDARNRFHGLFGHES